MPIAWQAIRRSVHTELGPFAVKTVTTTASDLVSFTSSALVNSNAESSQYQGWWAYCAFGYAAAQTSVNALASRQIAKTAGFDPENGACTVARAFSTSVVNGTVIELSSRLPARTDDFGTPGLTEIANDCLLSLPPIDLLPVTGMTSQSAYDLTTTYSWLTEKSQILGIYYQDTGEDYPSLTGYSWDWLYDADAPRLLLPSEPFQTGQTFYVKARRPAQSWIKSNGTWAASSVGLLYEDDEALVLLPQIRAQMLSVCYRLLGARTQPDEYAEYYREREAFWTAKAYALRWWDHQEATERATPQFRMIGGRGQRYGHGASYGV